MPMLIDIVNFNSDASCLSSNKWLKSLQGGKNSRFCQFLDNYITNERKTNIGLTGVTVKDLAYFNPEAIEKINSNPGIFQIILRTYSHDLSPLHSSKGFKVNLEMGLKTIKKYFITTTNVFLPNEVMIRNQQIEILDEFGIKAIFIKPQSYASYTRQRIFKKPYYCQGTNGTKMLTIPIDANLTDCYLEVLYRARPFSLWTKTLGNSRTNVLWHDGESVFLFPGGLDFAGMLFEQERKKGIRRLHLSEVIDGYRKTAKVPSEQRWLKHFPAYPMRHWLGDFKLMWMFRVLNFLEERIDKQSLLVRKL